MEYRYCILPCGARISKKIRIKLVTVHVLRENGTELKYRAVPALGQKQKMRRTRHQAFAQGGNLVRRGSLPGAKRPSSGGLARFGSNISPFDSSWTPGVFYTVHISLTTPVVSALKNYYI